MKGVWVVLALSIILIMGPIAVGPVIFADDLEFPAVQSVQPHPLDDDDEAGDGDDDDDDDDEEDDDDDDDDDDDESPVCPPDCGAGSGF